MYIPVLSLVYFPLLLPSFLSLFIYLFLPFILSSSLVFPPSLHPSFISFLSSFLLVSLPFIWPPSLHPSLFFPSFHLSFSIAQLFCFPSPSFPSSTCLRPRQSELVKILSSWSPAALQWFRSGGLRCFHPAWADSSSTAEQFSSTRRLFFCTHSYLLVPGKVWSNVEI